MSLVRFPLAPPPKDLQINVIDLQVFLLASVLSWPLLVKKNDTKVFQSVSSRFPRFRHVCTKVCTLRVGSFGNGKFKTLSRWSPSEIGRDCASKNFAVAPSAGSLCVARSFVEAMRVGFRTLPGD